VFNPDLVVLMKSELFIAFHGGDRCAFVPLLHIAELQTIRNGRARKPARRKRRN
jgi:hypothetical protein